MNSISMNDIQKNISLLTQLTDVCAIIDKNNKEVAILYPVKKYSLIASIAGKYSNRVVACDDLVKAKEML